MRTLLVVTFPLVVFGSVAMAQNKLDTKWHCPKESAEHHFDVGDVADHTYTILQGTCEATASRSGLVEKSASYTEFREMWQATANWHGRFNVTLDNGDKLYYSYEGSGSNDIAKPVTNRWKIGSGTGKHKGIKGSGTCSGKRNADGSSDWACKGTYSIAK